MSVHDETTRTVSPGQFDGPRFVEFSFRSDSNIGDDHSPPRPGPYVDDSEPDIVYEGAQKNNGDIVTIGVHELDLNERCSVFADDDREKVFVSVEFLDFPLEALETPYALPKGTPNTKYSFNFQQGSSRWTREKNILVFLSSQIIPLRLLSENDNWPS